MDYIGSGCMGVWEYGDMRGGTTTKVSDPQIIRERERTHDIIMILSFFFDNIAQPRKEIHSCDYKEKHLSSEFQYTKLYCSVCVCDIFVFLVSRGTIHIHF
jgi:hypothetical protein